MSLLADLLSQGAVGVPSSVGSAYDSLSKTGSWVISGIADYKKYTDNNFAKIRDYFKKYFDFKNDPTKALWMVDMLTRKDPVPPPPRMGSEDWNLLRSIWNKIIKGEGSIDNAAYCIDPEKTLMSKANVDRKLQLGQNDKLTRENILNNLKGNIYKNKIIPDVYSANYEGPYSTWPATEQYSKKKIADIIESELGVRVKYNHWHGFEVGNDSNWSIQLFPYNGPNTGNVKGRLLSEESSNFTFTPKLPSYHLPAIFTTGTANVDAGIIDSNHELNDRDEIQSKYKWNNFIEFSFGRDCPCIAYNLSYGQMGNKSINLFNNGSINIPLGFNYNMSLGVDIVDDNCDSFRKYMTSYINNIYNQDDSAVARYDQCAFLIRLLIFEDNYRIKTEFRFVGVPYNHTPQYEGNSSVDANTIHVDFSIVGMINPTHATSRNNVGNENEWTKIIMAPNIIH